ncbi:MAG: YdcF family protein [Betaproteobacteria bacterium]|nr:YdcF family protein [Betaproteobacteria bacterium]
MNTGWFITNTLAAFLLPPLNLVLVGLLGVWLLRAAARRRRPLLGKTLIVVALLGLTLLSTPWLAKRLLATLEAPPLVAIDKHSAEAIVILGGGTYRNAPEFGTDNIKGEALERLRYGAYLARQTGKPILVSGGAPSGGPAEGPLMQAVLEQDFRVPARWVEARSDNTRENAAYSAEILKKAGITRIWLVSQAWHLPRAIPEFERHGLTVIAAGTGYVNTAPTIPLDFVPNGQYLRYSHYATHEAIGRVWYRLRALFDGKEKE